MTEHKHEHKHTPGEWIYLPDWGEIRDVETFTVIATVPELDDRPADFTLMAAAPALLYACNILIRYIMLKESPGADVPSEVVTARAAIKRATGEAT